MELLTWASISFLPSLVISVCPLFVVVKVCFYFCCLSFRFFFSWFLLCHFWAFCPVFLWWVINKIMMLMINLELSGNDKGDNQLTKNAIHETTKVETTTTTIATTTNSTTTLLHLKYWGEIVTDSKDTIRMHKVKRAYFKNGFGDKFRTFSGCLRGRRFDQKVICARFTEKTLY